MKIDWRILLVEDRMEDAEMIQRGISKTCPSHDVIWVTNGLEALNHLSSCNSCELPHIILLDLNMPGLSGLETLKQIRNSENLLHVPIIILSSSGLEKDLKMGYKFGCNSYLVKPHDYKVFENLLSQLCSYWLRLNEVPHV